MARITGSRVTRSQSREAANTGFPANKATNVGSLGKNCEFHQSLCLLVVAIEPQIFHTTQWIWQLL